LETTDPEIPAIDSWEAFRTAVHEAIAEGRTSCRGEEEHAKIV
jgi:hypothetical protein